MQEADDILDASCLGGTNFLIWGNKFFVNLDPKMA